MDDVLRRAAGQRFVAVGRHLRAVRPCVGVTVVVVRVHRRRVVQDLDADHLGLGEPVDDHGGGQDQRQQAQREGLPGLERDDGDGHRDQHGRLELQAQQERDDDLPDETAACAQRTASIRFNG